MKIRELPCGHRAHDVVSVDVRRGHKVGSQLCARQFNQGQARGNMFGETPEQVLIASLISTAASGRCWGILTLDISVALMHTGTNEGIYVNTRCTIELILATTSRNQRETQSESTVARLFQ